MRVAIGSDHAGFALKGELCSLLDELRVEYRDFGTFSTSRSTTRTSSRRWRGRWRAATTSCGIVLGGSGTGEAIVANKVRGIRCVQATNPVVARLAREHNDANVIAFGARIVGTEVAKACLREFLAAEFQGGRHVAAAGEARAHRGRGGRVAEPPGLDDRERAILAGDAGAGAALAMRLVVRAAEVLGAERLIPITRAHVDSCLVPRRGDHRLRRSGWSTAARRSASRPR